MRIKRIKEGILRLICRKNPKWVANYLYKKSFGRDIDWKNPTEFNEKLRWMQFCTDTSIWSLLADKYKVRKYVEEKGYGSILVKLYGVWNCAEEINFDLLPKCFVLKTNHGSGEVMIIKDKQQINKNEVQIKMNKFLRTPYGYKHAEPHYLKISPVIIAEEMIENDCDWSSSIVDYKFYCFDGEPFCCAVFFNRCLEEHKRSAQIYDMEWKRHDEWLRKSYLPQRRIDIPRPLCFDQMVEACRDLATDFPFVRMDFYETSEKGGKFYFGEFTFTPAACTGGSLSPKVLQLFSQMMNLPR